MSDANLYAVPIQQMVDNFRHVLEGAMSQFEDPRDAVTAAATAGIIFAGLQAGTLFALGDWPDTPEQRAKLMQMVEANLDVGIVQGKRKTAKQLMKNGRRQ